MIKEYLEGQGFEARETRTGWTFFYDNLRCFSLKTGRKSRLNLNILRGQTLSGDVCTDSAGLPYISGTEEGILESLTAGCLPEIAIELTKFNEVQTTFTEKTVRDSSGTLLTYRSNLDTERQIVDSVFLRKEYQNKGLEIAKEDTVLDLGGNVGAFALSCYREAKRVVTVEPERVNFGFILKNISQNKAGNILPINSAVVGNQDKTRKLYLGKVPYYYSFLVKNNRKPVDVACVNINGLLAKHRPTKLKVDIEGSEWETLTSISNFREVSQIVFEYNFDMNGDLKKPKFSRFSVLVEHLSLHGFNVEHLRRDMKNNWNLVFLVKRDL